MTIDEIKDAAVAQRIVDDPVFQRAAEQADDTFVSEWRDAPTIEEREQAHAKQAALQEVIRQLRSIIGDGEIARRRG